MKRTTQATLLLALLGIASTFAVASPVAAQPGETRVETVVREDGTTETLNLRLYGPPGANDPLVACHADKTDGSGIECGRASGQYKGRIAIYKDQLDRLIVIFKGAVVQLTTDLSCKTAIACGDVALASGGTLILEFTDSGTVYHGPTSGEGLLPIVSFDEDDHRVLGDLYRDPATQVHHGGDLDGQSLYGDGKARWICDDGEEMVVESSAGNPCPVPSPTTPAPQPPPSLKTCLGGSQVALGAACPEPRPPTTRLTNEQREELQREEDLDGDGDTEHGMTVVSGGVYERKADGTGRCYFYSNRPADRIVLPNGESIAPPGVQVSCP